jgi:7-cyano-7-deazaguanine tRNA-ribosyltransferase
MRIVAGLSVKNLQPRVWDPQSPFYLPKLRAVMVSYSDFHQRPGARRRAMEVGLRQWLGLPDNVQVYLDNGSFYLRDRLTTHGLREYEDFVRESRPDWWPIPRDFIPLPHMTPNARRSCYERTMRVNRKYEHDGFVPVVHIGSWLKRYLADLLRNPRLLAKPRLAIGGLVPHLLRSRQALSYHELIDALRLVRESCQGKQLHVFGIGGTATLHLASVLGLDTADSSGWRNRAARGIVQLPGSGDRVVAELGAWRGRRPSPVERARLRACRCPACEHRGASGLRARGMIGFTHRATHNLWVLLEEAEWVREARNAGTYGEQFEGRLDNSTYLPLIQRAVGIIEDSK